MTPPPPSASRPDAAPQKRPDANDVADAKARFVAAAYNASPLRAVERHPLLSVTATASVALAATVIIGEPLVRSVGGGLATHGLGIVNTLLRSKLAASLLNTAGPKAADAVAASRSSDPPPTV